MLDRASARIKKIVLILGSTGNVGQAAVQLAKARGWRIVTAPRQDGSDINTTRDDWPERLREMMGESKGPDVIADTIGNLDLMRAALP